MSSWQTLGNQMCRRQGAKHLEISSTLKSSSITIHSFDLISDWAYIPTQTTANKFKRIQASTGAHLHT